jgi:hypothetical protein
MAPAIAKSASLEVVAMMKRTVVALNPPRRMHDFLSFAKFVADRLSHDPLFDPPPPSLPGLEDDIAALESAMVAATTRAAGLAAVRQAREAKVLGGLRQLQDHVQSLANFSPSVEQAAELIARSGMSVKESAGPSKPTFEVKPGRTSGSAHAYARAPKTRTSYDWQYSVDGERWLSIPSTVRADAEFEGLVAGTRYSFRCRTTTRAGVSDWSEVVVFIVV